MRRNACRGKNPIPGARWVFVETNVLLYFVDASDPVRLVDSFLVWSPVDSSPELIHRARHWADAAQVSHWDSLIVAATELAGCFVLLSDDIQAGRQFDQVQVVDPFCGPA